MNTRRKLFFFGKGGVAPAPGVVATGGTVQDVTIDGVAYRVHTFITSGDFVVTQGGQIEYLFIGGGAVGGYFVDAGNYGGGGGGAGEFKTGSLEVGTGSFPLVVGAGSKYSAVSEATDGSPTSGFGIEAIGGFASPLSSTFAGNIGGSSGNGFDGGAGFDGGVSNRRGGGGASAIGNGLSASDSTIGNGADGIEINFNGTLRKYAAGGGGGASRDSPGAGQGGEGGGGNGSNYVNNNATNGEQNTGSGGGGIGDDTRGSTRPIAGDGADGVIMLRYKL